MAETRTKRARKKQGDGRKGLLKKPAIGKSQGRGGKGSLRRPVTNQAQSTGSAKLPGTLLSQGRGGKGLLDKPVGEVPAPFDTEMLTLAEEIRALKEKDGAESVMAKWEIGKRLTRAHKRLKHGQWERYLRDEAGYQRMTARTLIELAEWAPKNRQVLRRVKHLGPTKVYSVMKASAEVVSRLLARPWHALPGAGPSKRLNELSVSELKQVLKVLNGEQPPAEATAQAEAKQVLDDLLRDAKRVVRGTNKLLKLQDQLPDATAAVEQVADVRERLLLSLEKLDEAFETVG